MEILRSFFAGLIGVLVGIFITNPITNNVAKVNESLTTLANECAQYSKLKLEYDSLQLETKKINSELVYYKFQDSIANKLLNQKEQILLNQEIINRVYLNIDTNIKPLHDKLKQLTTKDSVALSVIKQLEKETYIRHKLLKDMYPNKYFKLLL